MPDYRTLPLTGPRVVAARMPADQQDKVNVAIGVAMGGPDLPDLPHLYFPYADAASNAARAARPLVTLSQRGKPESDLVSAFVAEHLSLIHI